MGCTRSPFSGGLQCCAFCTGPVNPDVITLNKSMASIQITRPTNRHVLARFSLLPNYRYRLNAGTEIRVGVDYAWCARCADFVEAERLWTPEDIENNLENLLLLNVKSAKHSNQNAVLAWRQDRTSPPRCLSCESPFAITKIESDAVTPHPSGDGDIFLSSDGVLGGAPELNEPVYYDPDGKRI